MSPGKHFNKNIWLRYFLAPNKNPDMSRCRVDPNYEPSKKISADPVTADLLRNVIHKTVMHDTQMSNEKSANIFKN